MRTKRISNLTLMIFCALCGSFVFVIPTCRDSYSPVNKAIAEKEPEYSSFEYSEVILTRPASGTYFFLKNDSLIIIVGGDTVYNAKKNKCELN